MEAIDCTFGSSHCFHLFSPAAISAYGYIIAAVLAISVGVQRSALMHEYGHDTYLQPARRIRWLPTLLSLSFLLRALWFVLRDMHAFEHYDTDSSTYRHIMMKVPFLSNKIDLYPVGVTLAQKLATVVYFSAFTLIVRFWDEVLVRSLAIAQGQAKMTHHLNVGSSNRVLHTGYVRQRSAGRSKLLFVIINVWMYLVAFALITVQSLLPNYKTTYLMKIDPIVVALFFLALSIAIAQCAYRLRKLFQAIEFSNLARMIKYRVVILASIFSTLFFIRAIVFIISTYWIELRGVLDPWLLYTIPELLPGVSVLIMMRVILPKTESPNQQQDEEESLLNLDNTPRVRSMTQGGSSIVVI